MMERPGAPAQWTIVLGTLALAITWPFYSDFTVSLLATIALLVLVTAGLVILTGIAGMTSFGQAAFVGLGSYATAWVCTAPFALNALSPWMTPTQLPWVGLILGLSLTFIVAWAIGAVTLRLSGHYLPLCTIAWGLSLYFLFGNLDFLGGQTGITGLPPLNLFGVSMASPRALGGFAWLLLLLVLWGLSNLLDSRTGRALRALKASRVMAESMGIDTSRQRIKAFVLAALLAAVSGWLYAHLQRFVNPTPFNLNIGIEYLFMAVVGGASHLWGAVLGATLITLLKQRLQDVLPQLLGASGNFEVVVFGLLMLWVLQQFPEGLWPSLAARWSRWTRWMGSPNPAQLGLQASANPLPAPPTEPSGVSQPAKAGRPAAESKQILLAATQVTRCFGGLVANDAVTLNLRAGEVHALIGPNGAGKSTFFNLVSGVDQPNSGQVDLLGHSMLGKPARDFAKLGLGRTFQHVRLLNQRSVLENVAMGAYRLGRSGWIRSILRLDRLEEDDLLAQARAQLERCGLTAHAHIAAGSLSLGQQRIVEIARALAAKPTVLLLDEPAAGLRHFEKQRLASLLGQLSAEGMGILIVEHDMDFVMNLADRITVLNFGSVIASGTPSAVQSNPVVLDAYLGGAIESTS